MGRCSPSQPHHAVDTSFKMHLLDRSMAAVIGHSSHSALVRDRHQCDSLHPGSSVYTLTRPSPPLAPWQQCVHAYPPLPSPR